MAIDWRKIVHENSQRIIDAARQATQAKEPVCVLVDIDDVRSDKAAPGVMQLIADTQLQGAVPVIDSEGGRQLVCIPVGYAQLLECLERYEDVSMLRNGIKGGSALHLCVVCFDGGNRTCLEIHVAGPERN